MFSLGLAAQASNQWMQFLLDASERQYQILIHSIAIADDQGRLVRPLAPTTTHEKKS